MPVSAMNGMFGGVHPAQHFLEVIFDGFVAQVRAPRGEPR
jgi:hypothetical protein